jgi:OOP family OmpA-OmpF porin
MKNIKIVSLLILAIILASGCATRSFDGRVACAAAGAVGGAAVGGIAGDSEGALAGAAIGGLLGFIICPSTAAEPEPAMEPEPGDADGDGVTDDKDRCPTTPAGAKVDANGCELDSDGDGVVDSKDACPNTPRGTKVDAKGCEIKAKAISLSGILFHHDSAELRDQSTAVLDATADTLMSNPGVHVEIAGHTDGQGDAAYNQGLSQRRADAVKDYLVSRGVNASRLSASGYGETQPVADNNTAEGRAQNRRVELRITQ